MDMFHLFFYGLIVWVIYMATFRPKQLMELDNHMRGNLKDTASDAKKAANLGMKVLNQFLKK